MRPMIKRMVTMGGGDGPSYYVSKTGNDSTGDGSKSKPWLTIDKALLTAPIAGNYNIRVGPGTYAENTAGGNYLSIARNFTNFVTVRPWHSGDAVIITDNTSGNHTIYLTGCHKVRFQSITIQQGTAANWDGTIGGDTAATAEFVNCTIYAKNFGAYCTNISLTFIGCTFDKKSGAAGNISALWAIPGAGQTTTTVLTNCTITGYGAYHAVLSNIQDVTGTATTTISGGTITAGTWTAVQAHGGTITMSGVTCNSTVVPPVQIGMDGASTYTTTGSMTGCTCNSTASHGLLIGNGSQNVTVTNCIVNGGDDGLVIKGTDITVTGCTINGGTMDALLFKGCTRANVQNCTINATANAYAGVDLNLENSTKCTTTVLSHNHINATTAANALNWGTATVDAGDGTCDYNIYHYAGSGNLGTVRSTSGITNLAGLQAAWSSYGVSGNDSHSTVV